MKRKLYAMMATCLMLAAVAQPVSASTDDPYYDKGRNYTKVLWGTTMDVSTMVISTHAWYDPNMGWGRERIRVWGRNDSVRRYYPYSYPTYYSVAGVNQANLRFLVMDDPASPYYNPSFDSLSISSTSPEDNSTSTALASVAYDLLGYKSVQTATLSVIIDSLFSSTQRQKPNGHDNTVVFRAGMLNAFDETQTSLPNTITYDNADEQGGTGITAKFTFNLTPSKTDFCVWPQAIVDYLIFTGSGGFFYVSSGAAGVPQTINTVNGLPSCS